MIMDKITCPKCNSEIKIIREIDWVDLDTYFYPVCDRCGWTTVEVFSSEEQVYLRMKS
jgi:C4-type Zn-finger protein